MDRFPQKSEVSQCDHFSVFLTQSSPPLVIKKLEDPPSVPSIIKALNLDLSYGDSLRSKQLGRFLPSQAMNSVGP